MKTKGWNVTNWGNKWSGRAAELLLWEEAEQLLRALPPHTELLLALLGKEDVCRWQQDSLKCISGSKGMAWPAASQPFVIKYVIHIALFQPHNILFIIFQASCWMIGLRLLFREGEIVLSAKNKHISIQACKLLIKDRRGGWSGREKKKEGGRRRWKRPTHMDMPLLTGCSFVPIFPHS